MAGPSADPATVLAAALDRLAAGYTFETTVEVAGKTATTASGRSIGGSSDFEVESGGATITYRSIPPRSWVKQAGKAWVTVDGTVPDGDPLDSLRSPTAVEAVDGDADVRVRATYPASAFGLTGDAPVSVSLTLNADGSIRATYRTTTAAGPASSDTTLTPAASLEPISAP